MANSHVNYSGISTMNHMGQTFGSQARPQAGLQDAIVLMKNLMEGEMRKNGIETSFSHLEAVLDLCVEAHPDLTEEQKIACILHDAVEEKRVTEEELRTLGYPEKAIQLVLTLTRDKSQETYIDFIRRVSHDLDAIPIKIADMIHNSQDRGENEMHHRRYALCIKYLEAVQNGKVKAGAPIEDALSAEELKDNRNRNIIYNHQTTKDVPFKRLLDKADPILLANRPEINLPESSNTLH